MGLPFENADYNEDEVGARKIPELTDVVLTNIQNDNVLVYNNGIWENQAQSGGSSITELDDIPGVTITNAQDNQFLKYISGVWVNSTDTDANTDNLNDLTDTLLTTPFGDDEVLKYSGGKWKNGNIPIEKLSNVYISNLQDGETLRYIHSNLRWENAYNIDTLNELSDVTISSNLNNHVLKYNHTSGVYKNAYLNVTDLGDTNITTLANGNTLIYNNGEWSAGNIPLSNFTNGTGISVTGTSPDFTITNTSPDETVILHNGTGISVTGTYPEFTITNTYQETDPIYSLSDAANVTTAKMNQWQAAYGWGDHAAQNYINIANGTGFIKNNGSGTWSYETDVVVAGAVQVASWDTAYSFGDHRLPGYLTQANVYGLTGLTWSGVGDNELIRRTSSTTADGAGMTLQDTTIATFPQTSYYKNVSYFGRHGLLTIPFGLNRFESTSAGYNQRIIPYYPILSSTTLVSGLYLHHLPSMNDYNVRVGVNNQYPSQDFQVGTTLYVNDTNKKVGIGIADPDENLEVDGSIQIDSAVEARLKFKKSGSSAHALSEITAERDGNNGGDLHFYTKVDGGNVTEKLIINNEGKLGFRGNYGTANQYLKNNASGLPEWTTVTSVSQAPLDTPVVATPSGTGNLTLSSGTGYNSLLTYTPAITTLPYFILHKSSSQTIPNSGGAVDSVDITWDGLYTASPLTAVAFSGGPTEFKVGVAGMYHLDINVEIGGTGAAKLELNVYIDGTLKNSSIINVYDAQSSTTSGDNIRETTLSCSFLKSLSASNVIKIQARAILIVAGTTMVVVAGSTTNRTQVSGFRVGPG